MGWIVAIIFLIIGLIIFYLLKKVGVHYYVLIFVVLLTAGLIAYTFGDTITEPTIKIINPNTTQEMINANITYEYVNGNIQLECKDDYELRIDASGNPICYNESPFGHSNISLFSFFFAVFLFCYITQCTFESWRFYLTPKILFYVNKYLPENKPINRFIDVYYAGDFFWTFRGYGAIKNSKENEIYIGHKNMVNQVSNLSLFKGSCQKVTTKYVFGYIGNDEKIFSQMFKDYPYNLKTHVIDNNVQAPNIFVVLPLSNKENTFFNTIKGNYGFGANRFKIIISDLFKMRKAIILLNTQMSTTNENTLGTALTISQKAANIGSGVNRLNQQDILNKKRQQEESRGQFNPNPYDQQPR